MSRGGPVIREINANSAVFLRLWKRLPAYAKEQGKKALTLLLRPPEDRPAKLHFHKMRIHDADVWSLHLTSDDRYKASLSVVNGVAVMRRCGTHEEIDRNPR